MWKNGRKARIRSPCPSLPPFQVKFPASPSLNINTLETMLRCDSITPFGCPVVPELYARNAISFFGSNLALRNRVAPEILRMFEKCLNLEVESRSLPTRMIRSFSIPASLHASRAMFRNAFCVTKAFAPESFSWNANSPAVYPGFAGDIIPPAQCVPHMTAGVSMQFGVKSASTSPFLQSHEAFSPFPKSMAVLRT